MKRFDNYAVEPCTAIALCDDGNESKRQNALLVSCETNGGEAVRHVVFGWNMPETGADFSEMAADPAAWEIEHAEHKVKEASRI